MANQTRAKSHLLDLIGNEKSIHMLMEKREEVLSKMCDAENAAPFLGFLSVLSPPNRAVMLRNPYKSRLFQIGIE